MIFNVSEVELSLIKNIYGEAKRTFKLLIWLKCFIYSYFYF